MSADPIGPLAPRRRPPGLVVAVIVTSVLVGLGMTACARTALVDSPRPLLVQTTQPGPAYRYGSASIYNACSLITLDDLRQHGLAPDLDQLLDEFYPVLDQPQVRAEGHVGGPSECHVFLEGNGNVQVRVQQAPYTDPAYVERIPLSSKKSATSYSVGVAQVTVIPETIRDSAEPTPGHVSIKTPAAVVDLYLQPAKQKQTDLEPIMRGLVDNVIQRLSAPPTREKTLSYSGSTAHQPDACQILTTTDAAALVGGPVTGFAHRRAGVAESHVRLNNGDKTYFSETTCVQERASRQISFQPDPEVIFTLFAHRDVESATARMRQVLDPHGSSYGPATVLGQIGDDHGAIAAPVLGDTRQVKFRVGRFIGQLQLQHGPAGSDSPDYLTTHVVLVAQAIANRLR